MADSIAQQIIDNTATLLLANSGITSVSTTARILFVDVPADAFPTVDVLLGAESSVYDPDETVEVEGELIIVGAVKGIDLAAAEELIRDCKDQLATDQTLLETSGSRLVMWLRPFSVDRDRGTWENSGFVMRCAYKYIHDFGTA